jgi:hypothetical protein
MLGIQQVVTLSVTPVISGPQLSGRE